MSGRKRGDGHFARIARILRCDHQRSIASLHELHGEGCLQWRSLLIADVGVAHACGYSWGGGVPGFSQVLRCLRAIGLNGLFGLAFICPETYWKRFSSVPPSTAL